MQTTEVDKKPFELDPDESGAPTQYEIDLDNPSILQVGETEQSQGGADSGIMWPSQQPTEQVTASVQ